VIQQRLQNWKFRVAPCPGGDHGLDGGFGVVMRVRNTETGSGDFNLGRERIEGVEANEEEAEELLLCLALDAAHCERFCRSFAR